MAKNEPASDDDNTKNAQPSLSCAFNTFSFVIRSSSPNECEQTFWHLYCICHCQKLGLGNYLFSRPITVSHICWSSGWGLNLNEHMMYLACYYCTDICNIYARHWYIGTVVCSTLLWDDVARETGRCQKETFGFADILQTVMRSKNWNFLGVKRLQTSVMSVTRNDLVIVNNVFNK